MKRRLPRRAWRKPEPMRPLPPSRAHLFRPASELGKPPGSGVAPLADTPNGDGWWVVKEPTAARPYWQHFTEAQIAEAQAAHDDSKLSFYPWTPTKKPD